MLFTDLKIPCPYDKAHEIYESKMQSHLFKCERNNKDTNKVVCPFNAVHRIDDTHYIEHITSCPNRRIIEEHVYLIEELSFEPTPYVEPPLPPQEEDWDLDPPGISYNPKFYVDRTCVLRRPVGITKSERKAFYEKEVTKFKKFRNNEIIYTSDSDNDEQSEFGYYTVSSSSTCGYVNEKKKPQTITRTNSLISNDAMLSPLLGLGRGTNFHRKSQIAAEKKPGKSISKGISSNFSLNEELTRNQFSLEKQL